MNNKEIICVLSLAEFLSTSTIASIIHSWIAQRRLLCTNTGKKETLDNSSSTLLAGVISSVISSVFPLCLNCTNLNVYIQILMYIYESWCIYDSRCIYTNLAVYIRILMWPDVYIRILMYVYKSWCIYTNLNVYIRILIYISLSCHVNLWCCCFVPF